MILQIKNLRKNYGTVEALKGISLNMQEGEILAFLGPNGAGKTTAISILTGLNRQTSGEIYYAGKEFTPDSTIHKQMIGIVPQHNNIDRDLSVATNLKVHGLLYGIRGNELAYRIDEVLSLVELTEQKNKRADELSGGMKRRLVIARGLLHKPKLLFLDEPSAGLDPQVRKNLYSLIYRLNRHEAVSIFLTTHYIEEAEALAGRVILIDKGRIVSEGTSLELKTAMGKYAIEYITDDMGKCEYFQDHETSMTRMTALSKQYKNLRLREVTLEDAFIQMTGKGLG